MASEVTSNERHLVFVVEGTAALAPYWPNLRTDYIQKFLSAFTREYEDDQCVPQKPNVQMALIVFYTNGRDSVGGPRRSSWTKSLTLFMQWLSQIDFSGGGYGEDSDIVGGLAEALTMCPYGQTATQTTYTIKMHCVLVAASKPFSLPMVITRPACLTQQNENEEPVIQPWKVDLETIAKAFGEGGVSLSIISPRNLPEFFSIYNAANPEQNDVKYSHSSAQLVLISQNFKDACANRFSAQSAAANVTPSSGQTGGEIMAEHQPTSNAVTPVESIDMTGQEVITSMSMASAPVITSTTPASLSHGTAQSVSGTFSSPSRQSSGDKRENVSTSSGKSTRGKRAKVRTSSMGTAGHQTPGSARTSGMGTAAVSTAQTVDTGQINPTPGSLVGVRQINPNLAQNTFGAGLLGSSVNTGFTGKHVVGGLGQQDPVMGREGAATGSQIGQCKIGRRQDVLANIGAVGPSSLGSRVERVLGAGDSDAGNIQLPSTATVAEQPLAIWEGLLHIRSNTRGENFYICRLQAFCREASSRNIAADWPPAMIIDSLLDEHTMEIKQYEGKAVFLSFRALDAKDRFLERLSDRKHYAAINLPRHVLFLSNFDTPTPSQMKGMVLSRDVVNLERQLRSQPHLQQQQQPSQLHLQQQQQESTHRQEPSQSQVQQQQQSQLQVQERQQQRQMHMQQQQEPSQTHVQQQTNQLHLQNQQQQQSQMHLQQQQQQQKRKRMHLQQQQQQQKQMHLQQQQQQQSKMPQQLLQQQQQQQSSQLHLQNQQQKQSQMHHQQQQQASQTLQQQQPIQPHLQKQPLHQQQWQQPIQPHPQNQQLHQQQRQQPIQPHLQNQQLHQQQQQHPSQLPQQSQTHLQQQQQPILPYQQQQQQQPSQLQQQQWQQQQPSQLQQRQPNQLQQQQWQQQQQSWQQRQQEQKQTPQAPLSTLAQVQPSDLTKSRRKKQQQRQRQDGQSKGVAPGVEIEFVQGQFPRQSRAQQDQKPQRLLPAVGQAPAQSQLPAQSRPQLISGHQQLQRQQQNPQLISGHQQLQRQQQNPQPQEMPLATGQAFPPQFLAQFQHQQQNLQPQVMPLATGQAFPPSQFSSEGDHQLRRPQPQAMALATGQAFPPSQFSNQGQHQQQNPQSQTLLPFTTGHPFPPSQFSNQTSTPISLDQEQQEPEEMPPGFRSLFPRSQLPN